MHRDMVKVGFGVGLLMSRLDSLQAVEPLRNPFLVQLCQTLLLRLSKVALCSLDEESVPSWASSSVSPLPVQVRVWE